MRWYLMLFALILACCDNFDVSFEEKITALTTAGDKYSVYEIHGTRGVTFERLDDGTMIVAPSDELNGAAPPQLSVRVLNPGPTQRLILSGLGAEDLLAPETSPTTLLVPLEGAKGAKATVTARVVIKAGEDAEAGKDGATGENGEAGESAAAGEDEEPAAKETLISTYKQQNIQWLSFKNSLQSLELTTDDGTPIELAPSFGSATDYTAEVDTDTPSLTMKALADADASIVDREERGGNEWTYEVAYGENALPLTVTAQNRVTVKTYTVRLTRPLSYNIAVAGFEGGSITVSGGRAGTTTVTNSGRVADRAVAGLPISLSIAEDAGYKFDAAYFKANTTVDLVEAGGSYTFTMPARDVIATPRFLSSDATLHAVEVTAGSLAAAFNPASPSFTINNDGSGELLKIKLIGQTGQDAELNPGATFVLKTDSGIELPRNSDGRYTLNPGKYVLSLTVTAETKNTALYTLNVNNPPPASSETPQKFEVLVNGRDTTQIDLKWLDNLPLVITVNNDFASYQWRCDGALLSETSATLNTTTRNVGGVGTHTIALKATTSEGKSYAKNITIQVL